MSELEQKESFTKLLWTLLSIILAIFLFLSSFFIIYANEMMIERNLKTTKNEVEYFYENIILWDYIKKTYDYKNSIVTSKDSDNTLKWAIRLLATFWFWFSLTLFFIPVFPREPKDSLSIKAFYISIIWVPIFILFLKLYLFYIWWWFNFSIWWLTDKPWWNWLSVIDKAFIIIFIIFIFIILWFLYYQINKKK